jgi:hypothetical protein
MGYRYLNVEKWNIKSKRKRNQFINEFMKRNYSDLMISKQEFKKRHKQNVIDIFNENGWDMNTQSYIEDCLDSHYWYTDPICYKTCLDNENYTDFNDRFIDLFGKDILKNEIFLRKIHTLRNKYLNNGW